MDYENININGDGPETPLIAKRAVTEKGTPKNIGYLLSIVYFVLCTPKLAFLPSLFIIWHADFMTLT
jgi:hypothetical protein